MSKNICDSCLNVEGCIVACNRKKQEMEKKQKTYVIKNDCNTQTVNTNINLCDHKVIPFNDCPHDEVELDLANKYEIVIRDGKTFIVRKKPQYPKTYKECCSVLNIPTDECYIDIDVPLDYNRLLSVFTELLICRKAYWKIAGEQMGLGKPWEPDTCQIAHSIARYANEVVRHNDTYGGLFILEFPTEEMRDAFYENLKDLIEQCKELL